MGEYTILRRGDAPDYTGEAPGAFVGYGRPLGAEQVALNVRVLDPHTVNAPPGFDPASGHSHATIEEIYLVLEGTVTVKLGDAIETLEPYDAVLVPPETVRAFRNDGDQRAVVAMVSVRVADPQAESSWHDGFWPD